MLGKLKIWMEYSHNLLGSELSATARKILVLLWKAQWKQCLESEQNVKKDQTGNVVIPTVQTTASSYLEYFVQFWELDFKTDTANWNYLREKLLEAENFLYGETEKIKPVYGWHE